MRIRAKLGLHLRRLFADRRGNFGVMTAIILPFGLAGAGMAMDLSNFLVSRSQLQAASDAASLAAASALAAGTADATTAPQLAKDFMAGQMANYLASNPGAEDALKAGISVNIQQSGSASTGGVTYQVSVSSSFAQPVNGLTHLLGWNTVTIGASSAATSSGAGTTQAKNPFSMYLVLDRSGSMSFVTDVVDTTKKSCANYTDSNWSKYPNLQATSPCYINKIAALKTAVAALTTQLNTQDPKAVLVRTGAQSFTDTMQTAQALNWGTSGITTYVNNLPALPTGGTDMTGAMNTAYKALTASSETTAQQQKGNNPFSKYIVLMTDGENTGNSSTWKPSLDTTTLQTCQQARDAGIVIYTVAFMAPTNGQSLLKSCAGATGGYFEANNMGQLVSAFQAIGQEATKQTTRLTQ